MNVIISIVKRIDGLTPVKYGLCLDTNLKYRELKRELSSLSGIPTHQLVMVMIIGPVVEVSSSHTVSLVFCDVNCCFYMKFSTSLNMECS